jgi:hypothetical protein
MGFPGSDSSVQRVPRRALSSKRIAAFVVLATFTPALVFSTTSCGPGELVLGTFAVDAARPEVGDDHADGAVPDASLGKPPTDESDASCEPDAIAAATLTPFQNVACRSCAVTACCAEMSACFTTTDAGLACASYARCIDECHFFADAGVSIDGSTDAETSHCESTCSSSGEPVTYSQLASCVATACECPSF